MRLLIELRRKRNGIEAKGVEDKADTMPISLLLLLDHSALEFVGVDWEYCSLNLDPISIIQEDVSPISSWCWKSLAYKKEDKPEEEFC